MSIASATIQYNYLYKRVPNFLACRTYSRPDLSKALPARCPLYDKPPQEAFDLCRSLSSPEKLMGRPCSSPSARGAQAPQQRNTICIFIWSCCLILQWFVATANATVHRTNGLIKPYRCLWKKPGKHHTECAAWQTPELMRLMCPSIDRQEATISIAQIVITTKQNLRQPRCPSTSQSEHAWKAEKPRNDMRQITWAKPAQVSAKTTIAYAPPPHDVHAYKHTHFLWELSETPLPS